ncbi:MAG TPA: hypothetical protein VL614_16630 [Acetobacteraceae bacterium]|nr:hypothetical protein [Acetobacteraceae bacterium]
MADLTLLYGAIDKLDCAITAYACIMIELDDDPERHDDREVAAIKWLYEVLRDEDHNVRGFVKLVDEARNAGDSAPPPAKPAID